MMPTTETENTMITKQTVDVLVLGGGIAGIIAAHTAREAGAEVLVLERAPQIGGNAPVSTAYFSFVDTREQRAAGIEDSVEIFMSDVAAQLDRERDHYGIVVDEDLVRRYAEESSDAYDWLVSIGVDFDRFIPRPHQHSVTRLRAVRDPHALRDVLEGLDVPALTGVRATRLLTEDGRVVGARVEPVEGGEPFEIRASRAVVLACGGYHSSHELRRRFQPAWQAEAPYVGIDTCTGDGHRMGDAVGGDLINMPIVPMIVRVASLLVEDCIAVATDGRRFHDEAGPYAARLEAFSRLADGEAYYLADEAIRREREDAISQMPKPPIVADTLPELAERIGVDPGVLTETVDRWNAFLASDADRDPEHGRVILPGGRRPLAEPPFIAIPMVPGVANSVGGLATDIDLRVVNTFGDPITGLLAVGDCLGGVNPIKGLGGIHLGSAATLARVAGAVAARG